MSQPSFTQVRELFEELLELPEDARDAALDAGCGGDDALRSEVRRLLESHKSDDFLRAPEAQVREELLSRQTAALAPGRTFAGFRVLGVLGEGGMGCVYEAEQQEPRRRVALKVLRPGVVSAGAVARFRWEAEALARLRHPGIAQVYASGVSGDGVPWFALELVEDARPITEAVAGSGRSLREVLELFVDVCDAIQHGHHHGVIHRDVKPANVLVDGEGRVKVIDFGVAYVAAADEAATRITRAGELLGTLGHMSPEQLCGDPDAVDARTDVYSLGALLHELVCGAPLHDLSGLTLTQIAWRVRNVPSVPPSKIHAGLAPELDWIVAAATDTEPSRRYASVSELAADVRRHLERRPLLAGPAGAAYRVRAFVRRHRMAVSAAAAVLLSLLAGLTGTTFWMFEARNQADRAERESALAQAVADFVVGLVRSPNPELDGNDVRVVDVLERADEQLARTLADHPEMAAELHATLGMLHYNLGLWPGAASHLEASLALAATEDGGALDDQLATRAALGTVRRESGDLDGAEQVLVDVHERRRALHGDDHPDTATSLAAIALLRHAQGRREDALALYRDAIDVLRRHLGPDDEAVLRTEANLAGMLLEWHRRDEAESLLATTIPRLREHLGPRHPATVTALANMASLYVTTRRFEPAAELLSTVMAVHRDVLPDDHPSLLADLSNLSVLKLQLGEVEEALALCTEVIDKRSPSEPRAPDVVLMRCNRVHMLHALGDTAGVAAEVDALIALELGERAEHVETLRYVENCARDVAQWGEHGRGLALARESLHGRARLAPEDADGMFSAWLACTIVVGLAKEGGPIAAEDGDVAAVFAELERWKGRLAEVRRRGADEEVALSLDAFGAKALAVRWRAWRGMGG